MPAIVGFRSILWLSLLATVVLGSVLRWALAGTALPWGGSFAFWKHAHSHLGFFGILFPLVWAVWREKDGFFLSRGWSGAYIAGLILSFAGFMRAGYVFESILGSTLVGLVWLVSAWKRRVWTFHSADWAATAPLGILLATLCIPPIALLTRRDPALAILFVRTFLSLLLFLVALPAVLLRLRIPAPRSPLWFLGGIASSLFLGVLPHALCGLGLPLLAFGLLYPLRSWALIPWEIACLWFLWALGGILLGFQILPNSHAIGIAGLHFTILGPFLLSAAWGLWPPLPPAWLRYPYLLWLFLLTASVLAPSFPSLPGFLLSFSSPRVSAIVGSLLAFWLFLCAFFYLLRSSPSPLGLTDEGG